LEKLLDELEAEKNQRKLSEARVNRLLKRQLLVARLGVVGMAIVAGVSALAVSISQTNTAVQTTNTSIDSLLDANLGFDALLERLQAKRKLDSWLERWIPINTRRQTATLLLEATSDVREYNRLQGHKMAARSVRFSPSGDRVVSVGGMDGTIKLWGLDGCELKTLLGQQGTIWDVNFGPNGRWMASASWDTTLKLWTLDGNELAHLTGHDYYVEQVKFSPDSQRLASASSDGTLKLWSLPGGKDPKTFKGHGLALTSVNFSPDGQTLASASRDGTIRLWRLDGTLLNTLESFGPTWDVSFSSTGDALALSSGGLLADGKPSKLRIWNLNLDQLAIQACDWLHDYLQNNPQAKGDRVLCDNISTVSPQPK
jgi:WD40 repeat protein